MSRSAPGSSTLCAAAAGCAAERRARSMRLPKNAGGSASARGAGEAGTAMSRALWLCVGAVDAPQPTLVKVASKAPTQRIHVALGPDASMFAVKAEVRGRRPPELLLNGNGIG